MYNLYNTLPENRSEWRNSYEIEVAALEHEKRRFQMSDEATLLARPQVAGNKSQRPGFLEAPLQILAILLG